MNASNPWFLLALLGTVGLYHVNLLATLLNLSALRPEPPRRLSATCSQEDHERALEYARVSARNHVVESSVTLAALLGFWFGGGFGWLDAATREWNLPPLLHGLAVVGFLFLVRQGLDLPFDIYDTFVTERQFGFNRTSPATFVLDRLKELALLAVLGLPLLSLLLWLFARSPNAALYGWLAVSATSLLVSFVAPRLILPLFFKFEPLRDEALRASIDDLARRLDFPVSEVSVIDGSRRSTKANALFAGFGRAKRIALFDTLVQNHPRDEILAVLAHEIGHHKLGHVPKQIALSLLASAVLFALLDLALGDPRLWSAFGVATPSVALGLVFFSIAWKPAGLALALLGGHLSRRFEFAADAFARRALGSADPMTAALTRLSRDHLANPTPHPFHVLLHDSHPPVLRRIEALETA